MPAGYVALLLSFLSTGMLAGYLYGQSQSRDWGSSAAAQHYVSAYTKWQSIDDKSGALSLQLGNEILTYQTGEPKISPSYISPAEMASNPPPKRNFDEDFQKLVALAIAPPIETGLLTFLLKNSPQLVRETGIRRWQTIAIGVVTLGTASLGYHLGYSSDPEFDDPVFRKTISDVELWKTVEEHWRTVYSAGRAVQIEEAAHTLMLKELEGQTSLVASISRDVLIEEAQKRAKLKQYLEAMFELHPEIATQLNWKK